MKCLLVTSYEGETDHIHDITGNVNLDHPVKIEFVRFLYYKVVIFPFSYSILLGSKSLSSTYPTGGEGVGLSFFWRGEYLHMLLLIFL